MPSRTVRVMLAQRNPLVGDIAGNTARVVEDLARGREIGADLVVFPEMMLCGYPPEDLLLRPSIIAACAEAVEEVARHTAGLTAVVGFPHRDRDLFNAAAILHDGDVAGFHHKWYLPNYSVFDEQRYFTEGQVAEVFERDRVRLGVTICEDVWRPDGPARIQALCGAELLVNVSASPYHAGKIGARRRMLATRAADNRAFFIFCNLVGGQDELVFDGSSLVIDPDGRILATGRTFEEDVIVVDLHPEEVFRERLLDPRHRHVPAPESECRVVRLAGLPARQAAKVEPTAPVSEMGELEEIYTALVFATGEYARKNRFASAVVGLSGGIDSALTASIAADALGSSNVLGIGMPTRFSSEGSVTDAERLAANMGIEFRLVGIDAVYQAYLDTLSELLPDLGISVTTENIQPRIRGNLLMAVSNELGHLVLSTGNKSETSVGFATLYGDTAGGFAPLKDVLKTRVYALARWRNSVADKPWIPEASLSKPPSPELRPNQTDQDVLPPYAILDPILSAYVEREQSVAEIVEAGFDRQLVEWIAARVDRAEYKRRQSPPGVKITERAFGRDRRMPMTKLGALTP